MVNKTRKSTWPVALMSLALFGVLAMVVAFAASPQPSAEAHGCADLTGGARADCESVHLRDGEDHDQVTQLDAPANVMVVANDDRQLTVSWDMVEGASGYRVTWDPASGNGDRTHDLSSEATSYTIGGLQPATTYSVGVTALGTDGESMDSTTVTMERMTNPVAYDLLLSHEAADDAITCADRTSPRDQCAGGSKFAGGEFEEVNATLNGDPDRIDKATIRAAGQRVRLHSEVKTDSPAETTTVTLRIENSDGTDELDGDPGITYETSGLNAPGVRSIEDGTLDIQIRDDASRVFDVYVTCQGTPETLTGSLDIEVRDDDQRLVAQATIMCEPVEEIVVTEEITACYTISGMPDQGDDPDTNAVEGEDIELLTTDKSVQLTVSSYEKVYSFTTTNGVRELDAGYPKDCPDWPQSSVFIRLVDQPGSMPMVDDDEGFVDENGLIDDHGSVTGVSSGGELMLDIKDTMNVQVPGQDDPDTVGVRKGTFRVFTPTDVEVGDRFFVELYDNLDSRRIEHQNALTGMEQDYERVVYCSDPASAEGACEVPPNNRPAVGSAIDPQTVTAGDTVTVQSTITDADAGDTLTWNTEAGSNAPTIATATVNATTGMVTIMGHMAGTATITVTAMDAAGESATQTIMVTVTAAELGKPTNVEATVDDSDPGSISVTITWTDGANADGHEVGLVDLADYRVAHEQRAPTGMSHTFTNVASGRYMAIVVSTMDAEFKYEVDIVPVP